VQAAGVDPGRTACHPARPNQSDRPATPHPAGLTILLGERAGGEFDIALARFYIDEILRHSLGNLHRSQHHRYLKFALTSSARKETLTGR
jgi:hypothetical protein